MQTYIHYGLGFSGKLLTDTEYNLIENNNYSTMSKIGKVRLDFKSFTEDYEGKEWGTVVLLPLGEIPEEGKMIGLEELTKLISKHKIIDVPTKDLILAELEKFNIAHLIDKVEFIIYSNNY